MSMLRRMGIALIELYILGGGLVTALIIKYLFGDEIGALFAAIWGIVVLIVLVMGLNEL